MANVPDIAINGTVQWDELPQAALYVPLVCCLPGIVAFGALLNFFMKKTVFDQVTRVVGLVFFLVVFIASLVKGLVYIHELSPSESVVVSFLEFGKVFRLNVGFTYLALFSQTLLAIYMMMGKGPDSEKHLTYLILFFAMVFVAFISFALTFCDTHKNDLFAIHVCHLIVGMEALNVVLTSCMHLLRQRKYRDTAADAPLPERQQKREDANYNLTHIFLALYRLVLGILFFFFYHDTKFFSFGFEKSAVFKQWAQLFMNCLSILEASIFPLVLAVRHELLLNDAREPNKPDDEPAPNLNETQMVNENRVDFGAMLLHWEQGLRTTRQTLQSVESGIGSSINIGSSATMRRAYKPLSSARVSASKRPSASAESYAPIRTRRVLEGVQKWKDSKESLAGSIPRLATESISHIEDSQLEEIEMTELEEGVPMTIRTALEKTKEGPDGEKRKKMKRQKNVVDSPHELSPLLV